MEQSEIIDKRIYWNKLQIIFDIILIIFIIAFSIYLYINFDWLKQLNNPCEACMLKTNSTCLSNEVLMFNYNNEDTTQHFNLSKILDPELI